MSDLKYFVLEHDRRDGANQLSEYSSAGDALAELSVREARRTPPVEVVLLMAHSRDELTRTHGRYFLSIGEMAARLRDDMAVPTRSSLSEASASA